jgi:flagellar basal body L-ring protein FlgH
MTWKLMPGALVVLAALTGCAANTASTSSSPDTAAAGNAQVCNADLAESAVGQAVSPALVENYRKQAHAESARALRPNDVITMEYNPQRLNLKVDEQDIVISVNCS